MIHEKGRLPLFLTQRLAYANYNLKKENRNGYQNCLGRQSEQRQNNPV